MINRSEYTHYWTKALVCMVPMTLVVVWLIMRDIARIIVNGRQYPVMSVEELLRRD